MKKITELLKTALTLKNTNTKKVKGIINNITLLAVMIGAGIVTFSCGNDGPDPIPQPPVQKTDTVKRENLTSLSSVAELLNYAAKENTYVIFGFQKDAKIKVSANDTDYLDDLNSLLGMANVRFSINGAVLVPATDNISLTDEQCRLLVRLWARGLKFSIGDNNIRFYINSTQKGIFTDSEQLGNIFYQDADLIKIENTTEFAQKCTDAAEMAKNQPCTVQISKGLEINADELFHFRKLWNTNISVVADGEIIVHVRKNVSAYLINSAFGIPNVKINLIIHENENAPWETSLGLNDTTMNITRTKETMNIKSANVDIKDIGDNLMTPVFGTWNRFNSPDDTKSIDGQNVMPIQITVVQIGTYDTGENGGFEKLVASHNKVNSASSEELYPHVTDGDIELKLPAGDTFRADYEVHGYGNFKNCTNIYLSDFDPVINRKPAIMFRSTGHYHRKGDLILRDENIALVYIKGSAIDGELSNGAGTAEKVIAQCQAAFERREIKLINVKSLPKGEDYVVGKILNLTSANLEK